MHSHAPDAAPPSSQPPRVKLDFLSQRVFSAAGLTAAKRSGASKQPLPKAPAAADKHRLAVETGGGWQEVDQTTSGEEELEELVNGVDWVDGEGEDDVEGADEEVFADEPAGEDSLAEVFYEEEEAPELAYTDGEDADASDGEDLSDEEADGNGAADAGAAGKSGNVFSRLGNSLRPASGERVQSAAAPASAGAHTLSKPAAAAAASSPAAGPQSTLGVSAVARKALAHSKAGTSRLPTAASRRPGPEMQQSRRRRLQIQCPGMCCHLDTIPRLSRTKPP